MSDKAPTDPGSIWTADLTRPSVPRRRAQLCRPALLLLSFSQSQHPLGWHWAAAVQLQSHTPVSGERKKPSPGPSVMNEATGPRTASSLLAQKCFTVWITEMLKGELSAPPATWDSSCSPGRPLPAGSGPGTACSPSTCFTSSVPSPELSEASPSGPTSANGILWHRALLEGPSI